VAVYNTTALWSSSVQVIKIKKKKKTTKKMIHMERDNQVHHTILELDTFVLKEFLGKLMKWNGI
jgi:hypothetical protein